jgi:DNA-directed RNA polymerase sigma subunit (sigma70/sigma32)
MAKQNTKADAALREMVKHAGPEETFTLQQIADRTGLTAERVRQIERKALKRMREKLADFCKREGFDPSEL